jgi:homocitrate synthase
MQIDSNIIYDVTAREGRQSLVGPSFSHQLSLNIAERLYRAGVCRQELGSPAAHPLVANSIRRVADYLPNDAETWIHIRCNLNDAKTVPENVKGVGIFFGTSEQQRMFSHGKDIDYIIDRATETINYLKDRNYIVRFTAEDATRTGLNDLMNIYQRLQESTSVDIFGFADTVGYATPVEIRNNIRQLSSTLTRPIQFHGHNDGGYADINAIAALVGGAGSVQTSMCGLGERNGIADTINLTGIIDNLGYEIHVGELFDLNELRNLGLSLTEVLQIPENYRSLSSSHMNLDMAGLHVAGAGAYSLRNCGPRRYLINHPLTGRHAVASACQEIGISIDEDHTRLLTNEIKRITFRERIGDPIRSDEDVRSMLPELASQFGVSS